LICPPLTGRDFYVKRPPGTNLTAKERKRRDYEIMAATCRVSYFNTTMIDNAIALTTAVVIVAVLQMFKLFSILE
jgi:hypothetical protein